MTTFSTEQLRRMVEEATAGWIDRTWVIYNTLRAEATRRDEVDLTDDALFAAAVEIMRAERSGR